MNTHQLLTDIEQKVKKLKLRSDRLEKENEEMRHSVFGYLQKLQEQQTQYEDLLRQFQAAEMSKTLHTDRKTMQKELDRYIHLIDQCLASLNAGLIGK